MKSNVYTRTGDNGQTCLVGGKRVDKDCTRLEAYGTIDELNSHIGLLASMMNGQSTDTLIKIQNHLFVIGSYLATDTTCTQLKTVSVVSEEMVEWIEQSIDDIDSTLPPLQSFVLPGGSIAASQAHVCRTVCRRAERRMQTLGRETNIDSCVLKYINRLSDYLFVLARKLNITDGKAELFWSTPK